MFVDEMYGVIVRFGIEDIGDVVLLVECNVFGFVFGDWDIVYFVEESVQFFWFWVGEFDKFEVIGVGWVVGCDLCGWGVVWEWFYLGFFF